MTALFVRLAGAVMLAVSLGLPGWAVANPLAPGAALPALLITDQHDRPVVVDAATRLLIFAADKAGSDLAQGVLKTQEAGVLGRIHAVYVADISGMPALITRMFALPKLKDLPFVVGIVRDAAQTAALPRQPGQVTVLALEAGKVLQIHHAGDADALKRVLGL